VECCSTSWTSPKRKSQWRLPVRQVPSLELSGRGDSRALRHRGIGLGDQVLALKVWNLVEQNCEIFKIGFSKSVARGQEFTPHKRVPQATEAGRAEVGLPDNRP
jgi:hypothetical protein